MSKYKFVATNRERFQTQKTQELISQELKNQRKHSQRQRQVLLPLQKFAHRGFQAAKPVRSEGKVSQRIQRLPIELFNLKESLLLRNQRESFQIKGPHRKKASSNRMATQKIQNGHSTEKRSSVPKILVRGFGKESPERNNFLKEDIIRLSDRQQQSPRRSLEKKLTVFEREQSKNYEIYYVGMRRITGRQDFTDGQGDSKTMIGDAIAYRYQILGQLGRGSFGRVFRAMDHKKKEHVALKIIKSQQKFATQAKVEIAILETALLHDQKLKNNIVRLKGSFVFRSHTCLKFEILSKNLYEFVKQSNFSGFSLDLIRRFAIQILQALLFLGHHKIIHCDLKPENILLKQENKSGIKVIDLGSGCFEDRQLYTYIQSRFYRAPEIILGIRYTTAIDMWSFGCILAELYTGLPIFPGQNENQQMLMFIELLGLPPSYILAQAERRKKFFTDDGLCKISGVRGQGKQPKSLPWDQVLGSDCDPLFVDLLQKCFDWDPARRLTPKQGLLHQWVLNGLPNTIRAQHVEQITHQI